MRVGVVGASGYAGGELLRLLANHPHFKVGYIAAGSNAGEKITSIHSNLVSYNDQVFSETSANQINECELVFLALPHGESGRLSESIKSSVKIVDLGADFRLKSEQSWNKYYNAPYAGSWDYGLPELPNQRQKIKGASRISNPGCYATAAALAVAPVTLQSGVQLDDVVMVAASGTTGAGRSAKINLSASEIVNSLTSYKFGGVHQHTPEIEETLNALSGDVVKISFTPILAPMPRGILATLTLKTDLQAEVVRNLYQTAYEKEKFVKVLEAGQMPETSSVLGSNSAHLQVAVDEHTSRLVISVAIDNLGKGAAGQALQNANLMCGFAEDSGLNAIGLG